jgi:hypothetical protein
VHVIFDRAVVVEIPGAWCTRIDCILDVQVLAIDRNAPDVKVAVTARRDRIVDEGKLQGLKV